MKNRFRKTLTLLLSLCMVVTMIPGMTAISFASDEAYTGQTASGSYEISTAAQLAKLAAVVNTGVEYEGSTFTLTADIDLSVSDTSGELSWTGGAVWTPIAQYDNSYATDYMFKGIFDGDGHYVKNMTISGTDYSGGSGVHNEGNALFGKNAGTIKYLGVTGSVETYRIGAGVTGLNTKAGKVENCFSKVSVSANGGGGQRGSGGIVGSNFGTVSYCINAGSIHNAYKRAGGIVGYNISGTVSHCYSIGSVSSADDTVAGGIAGVNEPDYAFNAVTTPDVASISAYYVEGAEAGNYIKTTDTVLDAEKTYYTKDAVLPVIEECYYLKGSADGAVGSASTTAFTGTTFGEDGVITGTTDDTLLNKLNDHVAGAFVAPATGIYPVLAWQNGFSWVQYTVTITQPKAGGTLAAYIGTDATGTPITGSAVVDSGTSIYVTATEPEDGYLFMGFDVNEKVSGNTGGVFAGAMASYSITEDTEIAASYLSKSSTALTVYTQTGTDGAKTKAKDFTWAELLAAKDGAAGLLQTSSNAYGAEGYMFTHGTDGWRMIGVTQYVTIADLLAQAGVTPVATDQIIASDGGNSSIIPTYETLTAAKYFYTSGTATVSGAKATPVAGSVNDKIVVPAAMAVSWASGKLTSASGTTGSALTATAANCYNSGSLRFVWGSTESDYTACSGPSVTGNRLWSGVYELIVRTPSEAYAGTDNEIIAAPVVDQADSSTPYTGYSVSYSAADSEATVTATGLRAHKNGAGNIGHWVGLAIPVPASTEYGEIKVGTNGMGLTAAGLTGPEYTAGDKKYITVYWDAASTDMTGVQVTFDGTTIKEIAVDDSGVECDNQVNVFGTDYGLSLMKTHGQTKTFSYVKKDTKTEVSVTGITMTDLLDKVVGCGAEEYAALTFADGADLSTAYNKTADNYQYNWDNVMLIWDGDGAKDDELKVAVNGSGKNLWVGGVTNIIGTETALDFGGVYLTENQVKEYPTTGVTYTMEKRDKDTGALVSSTGYDMTGATVADLLAHYAPELEPAVITFEAADGYGSNRYIYNDEYAWDEVMVAWSMVDKGTQAEQITSGLRSALSLSAGNMWVSKVVKATITEKDLTINDVAFTQARLASKADLDNATWYKLTDKENPVTGISGITVGKIFEAFPTRLSAEGMQSVTFSAEDYDANYTPETAGDWTQAAVIWAGDGASATVLKSAVNHARGKFWANGIDTVTGNYAKNMTFTTTPANATVAVKDSTGAPLTANADGSFPVVTNSTYTYTVSANGYTTQSADVTPTNSVLNFTVTLNAKGGGSASDPVEEEDAVLKIYGQDGKNGTPELVKSFTESELNGVKTKGKFPYLYYKNNAWEAIVATEVVSLDTILDEAGLSSDWDSKAQLYFTCSDGVYGKSYPSYNDINAAKYYFDAEGDATEVPAGIALTWDAQTVGSDGATLELTTENINAIAKDAYNSGSFRFVFGITESQYQAVVKGSGEGPAGARSPSGVLVMTVAYNLSSLDKGSVGTSRDVEEETTQVTDDTKTVSADVAGTVSKGEAVVKITDSQVDKAVESAEEASADSIVFNAKYNNETGTVNVGLSAAAVKSFSDANLGFILQTPDGNLTYDKAAVAAIAEAAGTGSAVSIRITSTKSADLNDSQQKLTEKAEKAQIYDVSIIVTDAAGKDTTVSSLGAGSVKVSLSYTGTTDTDKVAGYYLPENGAAQKLAITYNKNTKTFEFVQNHQSDYALVSENTAAFTDVVLGDWFYSAANYAVGEGIMNGLSDTTFSPDTAATRTQIVTVLWRQAGSPKVSVANPFKDVKSGDWYYDAVLWAFSTGLTTGVSATEFGTDVTLTREQLVTFLSRYAAQSGKDTAASGSLEGFTDASAVDSWAQDPMKWAVGKGIITGMTDTTIVPAGTASRVQLAAMIQRMDEAK